MATVVENVPVRRSNCIQRTAFRLSRRMEFFSVKELEAQTGHGQDDFPLVVLKELIDNALDACEEAKIAPTIDVKVDGSTISVTDNGPGIPKSTIDGVIDFDVRTSSREAYVAPDRGRQGNALKTIIAMPFALSGQESTTDIHSRGMCHRIRCKVNQLRQTPEVLNIPAESNVKTGTKLELQWPDSSSPIDSARERFLQIATGYAVFNPHLSLSVNWSDEVRTTAVNANWTKWLPCNPTSPHWYQTENLIRLIGAKISHGQDAGTAPQSLNAFLEEFSGLTSSGKRKKVLADACLSRKSLMDLVRDDSVDADLAERLLLAMKNHAKRVKPAHLGIIGEECLRGRLSELQCEAATFDYRKKVGETDDGVPWVVEAAFGALSTAFEDPSTKYVERRRFFVGVNWSPTIIDPFRLLLGESLDAILMGSRCSKDEPVVVVLHLACPRIHYADRGKSSIILPDDISLAIRESVGAVTKAWKKQRKAEERNASQIARRRQQWSRSRPDTIKDAAYEIMEKAYMEASTGNTLPAQARQIMYAARAYIQEKTGEMLDSKYFTQTLVPNFVAENPELTKNWDVVFDSRGNLIEPHTRRKIPLGTVAVRNYIANFAKGVARVGELIKSEPYTFPSVGPNNRYGAVMLIEKEGWSHLFERVKLAERYDIAIMSGKGQNTTALRHLADRFYGMGVPVLVLHDFDKSGFSILGTLLRETNRYTFANRPTVIDLGVRLDDVETLKLESEDVVYGDSDPSDNLQANGAAEEEIAFLCDFRSYNPYKGRRVELNALSSGRLLEWIYGKLEKHGIKKVLPDPTTLESAYRRAFENTLIEKRLQETSEAAARAAHSVCIPAELAADVQKHLLANPTDSWDDAVDLLARSAA